MAKKRKKKGSKSKLSFFRRLFNPEEPLFEFDVSKEAGREITAICLLVVAVFFLLSLFDVAGSLGEVASRGLRYLFGLVAFLVPVLLILGALEFFKPKKKDDPVRATGIIGGALFLLAFPALLHVFWGSAPAEAVTAGTGGGLIGYWISSSLSHATGGAVAFIISLAVTLIGIILIFDLSLLRLLGLNQGNAEEPTEGGVRINQPGKAPVFESIRRIGLGKRNQAGVRTLNAGTMPASPVAAAAAPTMAGGFQLPQTDILEVSDTVAESGDIAKNVEKIQKTLQDFGVAVAMGEVNVGPTVTQYTCKPSQGVKLNQITARSNDLALSLAAKSIRIEAPIPGKAAVGIEVPNKIRAKVTVREILESPEFAKKKSLLSLALGRDVAGTPIITDIEAMPHLLVAGATGSGKSVCINTMILSLLYQNAPDTLRLILVDPKRVELTMYNHIPHLLTPVITEADKTISALKWVVSEMDRRYRLFSETGRRNIQAFNEAIPEGQQKIPYLVLIIDELADLMSVAARDVEGAIVRLAQMARATGIHLIVATQRPSVDVITGLIKANIPTRVAFATASQADSRTILDLSGADKLLGNGDMLYLSNEFGKPKRIQGSFASDHDINSVIAFVKSQGMAQYNDAVVTSGSGVGGGSVIGGGGSDGDDELYNDAVQVVSEAGKASASLLQRRLRIGYARAARLLDILEDNGVIGPADGARPREVYAAGNGGRGRDDDPTSGIQAYPE